MPSKNNLSIPLPCPNETIKSESMSKGYEHRAWYYVEVLSDPPEAHITIPDGTYWGQTQEGRPVTGGFFRPLLWSERDRTWYIQEGGSQYDTVTLTLEKRGYKDTTKTFRIGPYQCIGLNTSPEELISQGRLGKGPDKTWENTIRVMVVLDPMGIE